MSKPLTQDQFEGALAANFAGGLDLMRKKNADYAGVADPFLNFRSSTLIGLNPGHAILLRMLDKMSRAGNLLRKPPEVASESLQDTLTDIMNYSNLLLTWWQSEGNTESEKNLDTPVTQR